MKKLILPLILVLTLAVSLFFVIGAQAEDNEPTLFFVIGAQAEDNEPTLELTGANLVFTERVHILFAVDVSNADISDVELLIFRGDNVNINDCVKGNEATSLKTTGATVNQSSVKGYIFEYGDLAAAEMTENVYARAYYKVGNKEYYSETVKYSVLQYACNKLGYTGTATENAKLKNMLVNMLLYGASAQEYFEVNLDRLATDTYVKYYFEDGVLEDGTSYGLFKKGETFTVTSTKVNEENPYAVWSNENGASMAVGASVEMTADKNRTVSSAAQATEPTFGSYKYVVIVGVDGAGCFYPDDTDTPNIDRIFADGAVTHTMRVASPTASSVSWMSCLHGVKPENHGNTENVTVEEGGPYTMDSNYPSILRVVKEARPDDEVACLYAWIGINGIVEDGDAIGITKQKLSDAAIVNYLESGYLEANKPTLTYLHFNNPDAVGHNQGHHTEAYWDSIETIDGYIGRIYAAYEAAGMIDDTLFIVTADHGGVAYTNSDGETKGTHGNLTDVEKYVMYAVAGKNVVSGGTVDDMYIRDNASIVLHALGVELPETYTSIIPNNLFPDVADMVRTEYHDPELPRYRVPEATPAVGTIENFVDKTLAVYLPFDGNTNELVNGSSVDEVGKITYEDGYFGQGVQLEDGHLNVHANFAPGTGSFTISTWAKFATPTNGSSPMIATKSWSGSSNGFVFATGRYASVERHDHYGALAFGNGSSRVAYSGGASCPELAFPSDYIYGWMHLMITVDKDAGLVKVSYDFGDSYVIDMPASIMNGDLTGLVDYITLGQDTSGAYSTKSGVAFDEFMIFYGALDAADVEGLKAYYGVDSSAAPEEDENPLVDMFNPDIFFEFDSFTQNKGSLATDVSKYGTFEYAAGIDGKAVYLDGTDYFTLDDVKFGTDSFAIATWVKPTDLAFRSGYRLPIISTCDNDSRDKGYGINVVFNTEHGNIMVTIADGTKGLQQTSATLWKPTYLGGRTQEEQDALYAGYPTHTEFANQWYHVAVVVDRDAKKLTVYLNFEPIIDVDLCYYGSSSFLPDDYTPDNHPLTVGQIGVPSATTPKLYLDDMMIFKRALTATEICKMQKYYQNPLSDYINETPVIDMAFDYDLTNNGSYTGSVEQEGTVNYVNGYSGGAAEFKAGSVDLEELELGKNSLTVSMWYNTEKVKYSEGGRPYRSNLFATAYKANSDRAGLHIDFSREYNCIFVHTQNGTNSARGYIMAKFDQSVVTDNTWIHIAVTIDTNPASGERYVRVYINFEEVAEYGDTSPANFGINSFDGAEGFTPHIGADGQGNLDYTANGLIDEFLLFDSALTAEEIAKLGEYYNQ